MKKLKLVIFFLLFFIPSTIYASTTVQITAPDIINPGQEIYVDVVLNSTEEIDQYKMAFIYESSNLELLNVEARDNWAISDSFVLASPLNITFTHSGITGKTTAVRLKFKVRTDYNKSEAVLNVESSVRNKSTQTIENLERVTKKLNIKSTDATLKELKINNELIVNFSPTTYTYRLNLEPEITTVTFSAVTNDSTAKFKKDFEPKKDVELKYGDNKFEIVVVAASGAEKKYVVTIVREDNRGENNNLKSLVINANPKLLNFNKNILEYNIKAYKLKELDITCTTEDPKAKVEIIKPKEVIYGLNEVKIKVTSENETLKEYKIVINNLDKEIDTTLKNIKIYGINEKFVFEEGKYDYELLYNNKYNADMVIAPELNSPDEAELDRGTMETDISNLKADGKVRIIIKAKDGTPDVDTIYTITFKSDHRVNFYLILSLIIFFTLLGIFIKLYIDIKKTKIKIEETEKELEKTKKVEIKNTPNE